MDVGTVTALWRYPVKSLAPERLDRARVLADGLEGDRIAALVVETPSHARAGKPFRGKESNRLHRTADPETAASFAAEAGALVTLDRSRPRWFDAMPVSVLVDRWVADVEALVGEELDPQRWRPNLFITAAPGFSAREPALVGALLRAGSTVLRVVKPIVRCVTPNYDIGTGDANPAVLKETAAQRDACVGVYCEVVTPGEIAAGDRVASD